MLVIDGMNTMCMLSKQWPKIMNWKQNLIMLKPKKNALKANGKQFALQSPKSYW